jgi:hypothetical protein
MTPHAVQSPQLLEGWKQVAHYLNVTERTAQVWARQRSMPIYRSSSVRGRVFVPPVELDRWKAAVTKCKPRSGRKAITVRLPEADYQRMKRLCLSCTDAATVQDLAMRAVVDYLDRLTN